MILQQVQLRHGTAAEWTAANPVLLLGELGYEQDTGKVKFGNGVLRWVNLPYLLSDIDSAPLALLFAPRSQQWLPNNQYTIGQIVYQGTTIYKVIANHLSPSVFNFTGQNLAVLGALAGTDYLAAITQVDGPGSGLDADTVDGVQAAAFALKAAAWTPNTVYVADQLVHNAGVLYRATSTYTSPASFDTTNLSVLGGGGTMSAVDIRTALLTVDGAGSGLDADTIDGMDSVLFARRSALWVASTDYKVNELVHNAGTLYRVTANFTSPGTFSTTNLTPISSAGGSLGSSSDVQFTTLADKDLVVYDTTTGKWLNVQLGVMPEIQSLSSSVASNTAAISGLSNQSTMVGQRGLGTLASNSVAAQSDLYSGSTSVPMNVNDKLIYTSTWEFKNEQTVGSADITMALLFKIAGVNTFNFSVAVPATGVGKRFMMNLAIEFTQAATGVTEHSFELHGTMYAATADASPYQPTPGVQVDYGAYHTTTVDHGTTRQSLEARWTPSLAATTVAIRRLSSSVILNRAS